MIRYLAAFSGAVSLYCCSGATTPEGLTPCDPSGTSDGDVVATETGGCPGGFCAADRRGDSMNYCTQPCEAPDTCPAGMVCELTKKMCVADTAPPCDPAQCPADNSCIRYQDQEICRLACDTQRGGTGCPFNYACVTSQGQSFCVADNIPVEKKNGQWGTPCNSNLGQGDPACDVEHGFYCQYQRENDANAFCTRFGCETDRDCTGGYYCGTANYVTPEGKHTLGDVGKLCLPRTYCSPCESDVDCGPAKDGSKQMCIGGADGKGFCTSRCGDDSNCNTDASCTDLDGTTKICYPKAQVCVGDGNFCSPCRSDADCTAGGACAGTAYLDEKACTVPAQGGCGGGSSACPSSMPDGAPRNAGVGCASKAFDSVPADHCVGLVRLDRSDENSTVPGCFSRPR